MSFQFRVPPPSALNADSSVQQPQPPAQQQQQQQQQQQRMWQSSAVPSRLAVAQQQQGARSAAQQPQLIVASTSFSMRSLVIGNKPRDEPAQQQQARPPPVVAFPSPPAMPAAATALQQQQQQQLSPSQAVAQFRLQEQGRNLPVSAAALAPRGVAGRTVAAGAPATAAAAAAAAAGGGVGVAARHERRGSSSSSSSGVGAIPGSRSDARMALRNARRNSGAAAAATSLAAAEEHEAAAAAEAAQPPRTPEKVSTPTSSPASPQRAASSPGGSRRNSTTAAAAPNDAVKSSRPATLSRAGSRSNLAQALKSCAPAPPPAKSSSSDAADAATASAAATATVATASKPLKPKDAAAADRANYVDTGCLIDLLWERAATASDEAAVSATNAMTIVPLFVDDEQEQEGAKAATSECGAARPASPRRGYVPTFLLKEQAAVPGTPDDIDCIWLSDSPFEYRTAAVVFPPCDLEALPPGIKETKENNSDIARPVVAPPPLRRYWAEHGHPRHFSFVEPAVHAALLKLPACNSEAARILLEQRQQQQQQQQQGGAIADSGGDDVILFRRAHSGFHRRVKRQGPNLRNALFFYSPSAARSSPALAVLRAGGLSEETTATHDTVRTCGFSVWWAKGVTNAQMAVMDAAQKVNHFPGTWAIGRKDNLNKYLTAQLRRFGAEHYGFFPRGYILPRDRHRLRVDMKAAKARAIDECRRYREVQEQYERECKSVNEQQQGENKVLPPPMPAILRQQPPRKAPLYIFKRVAGACGRGMRVVTKLPSASLGAGLVQEYVDRPLLVNGYKFDCRIYVAVTSFNPLRVYRYVEGLARFATSPYPVGQAAHAGDRTAHLTNFSINRNNVDAANGAKANAAKGKKQAAATAAAAASSSNVAGGDDNNRKKTKRSQRQQQEHVVDSCTEDEEDNDCLDDDYFYDDDDDDVDAEDDDDDASGAKQRRSSAAAAADNDDVGDDNDADGDGDDGDGGAAVPKWTFEMLHAWFERNQPPGAWRTAWARVDDVIIKTLLAAENSVTTTMRHLRPRERYPTCFFELFGFDVLLQADLQPVIMEVNIMCSLESRCSPLDQYVKGNMLADLMTLVGVVPLGRQNKAPTPPPAAVAPSLAQVQSTVRRAMAATAQEQQQAHEEGAAASASSSSAAAALPPALEHKCRALHQATQSFWHSLSHPQLVDVIAYTEEERIRKGDTWRRVYPPELPQCGERDASNNKNYYAGKYGKFYEEPRAADAALAQWHLLQSQAMELLSFAAASAAAAADAGDDAPSSPPCSSNIDVLNLLCNAKLLSPLFACV